MHQRRRILAFAALLAGGVVSACNAVKESKADEATPAAPSAEPVKMAPPLPNAAAPQDVAAPPADAEKTASGLASKVLKAGSGTKHPDADQLLKISYAGWRKDGVLFDQSPSVDLTLGQLMPGWAEGVQLMVAGESRRLWIPAALAFGSNPKPGIPAGDLTMDVTLIGIGRRTGAAPELPSIPAPDDVAAPPKAAIKTKSGLAYRTLTTAKGARPKATDTVTVQYTGWTPDGKMFDSSVARGKPASFALDHVIRGWTEGLELMHVGEKTRFWIPADLAYGDKPARPGAPSGMLVFDVELVSIDSTH